jgi:hypothetical protein
MTLSLSRIRVKLSLLAKKANTLSLLSLYLNRNKMDTEMETVNILVVDDEPDMEQLILQKFRKKIGQKNIHLYSLKMERKH